MGQIADKRRMMQMIESVEAERERRRCCIGFMHGGGESERTPRPSLNMRLQNRKGVQIVKGARSRSQQIRRRGCLRSRKVGTVGSFPSSKWQERTSTEKGRVDGLWLGCHKIDKRTRLYLGFVDYYSVGRYLPSCPGHSRTVGRMFF
jgi:hypothetical protein